MGSAGVATASSARAVGPVPPATNEGYPIIAPHDPTEVTRAITSRGATLGFSRHGGGYINSLDLGDGVNLVAPGFGRGGQTAVRDGLHSRRFNPTQGGYRDGGGTPVDMSVTASRSGPGERLEIPRFNLCLFVGDGQFNYNEHEDLYPKQPVYGPGDTDGIDETGLSQDDECRSEYDFFGFVEDASSMAGSAGIPVFKHYTCVEYQRDPGPPLTVAGQQPEKYSAIHQSGPGAVHRNGRPAIDESNRITDIAPELFPGEEATNTDMSGFFNRYSLRIVHSAGYHYGLWIDPAGNWQSEWLEPGTGPRQQRFREDRYYDLVPGGRIQGDGGAFQTPASEDLIIAATGEDPYDSLGVGIFFPQESAYNANPIVGIDRKTGKVLYTDDRRMRTQGHFHGGLGGGGTKTVQGATFESYYTMFRTTQYLTGMFAPGIHGHADAVERAQREVYLLIGTPEEIRAAADNIRRSLPRAFRPVPEVWAS
ncbi:hypothetical protein SAMN04488554_3985 [Ruania alba]|uniref:Uncharacterized protein n=2 Tax=Ruania alba TaxID=648782 RepID=A0A1H5N852_9MICO|nr:hypothetical protein SAMN04488554_3985 [Ruania alba]